MVRREPRMKLLFVSSEAFPWAKTGGLADAMGALPPALADAGHDVRLVLPRYDRIDAALHPAEAVTGLIDLPLGATTYRVQILRDIARPWAWFVDCPALFRRGGIYTQDVDEHRRFLALSVGALVACQYTGWAPDVVLCNDWQTAMIPLLLRTRFGWDRLFDATRTVLTIHNIGYQGGFSASIVPDLHIPGHEHLLHQDLLRAGRVNFLMHGVLYADAITTVSPTYAREIQTPAFGVGMDPWLRARAGSVHGILNGVDGAEWSPAHDPHLVAPYDADTLDRKALNTRALLARMGLPSRAGVPVLGVVSRLVWQKGLDLLFDALPGLLAEGRIQLVVLGSGEPRLERGFARLQDRFPAQVAFHNGFANDLAHQIEAGADIFLMPSRYEPCGLNQMYSLRYGTVPVVHRTGGLADTVTPWNTERGQGTGFAFEHHDATGLRWAVEAALSVWRQPAAWRRLQRNGMAMDFSWERQVPRWDELLESLRA